MTIADTLRQLGLASPDPRSDGELVGQFVRARDEPAFAELLRRHGPTVYGVCRRVLANAADADDAFQAVFLVLARKANTVRPPGMVGNWLYGVAVRTANKVRVMNAKRSRREGTPHPPGAALQTAPGGCGVLSDTLAVIDAELASLPDVYRAAFVTCELNGRSRSEASAELGWPEGTVAARLAKARELLAARLTKRGITLGAGLFAAVAVPTAMATEAMSAVRELLAVGTATAVAPVAQTLSDEVVKAMPTTHLKWLLLGGLVLSLVTGGAVLLAGGPEKQPVREQIKTPVPKVAEGEWKEADPITFKDGGRITSIAFAPSGKTFAVCRADGKIDFYDPATRKHQQSMNLFGDPKSNPNRQQGTAVALAFRQTPHAKLGDVFAVTHQNGVAFGTTTIGLLVDDPPKVEGLPSTWGMEGYDPHQVVWVKDRDGEDRLAATNGTGTVRTVAVGKGIANYPGWARYKHEPTVLTPASDGKRLLLRLWANLQELTPDTFDIHLVAADLESTSKQTLSGHKVRPVSAGWAQDGQRIVSADEGGTLIVWEGEEFEYKEKRRIELGEGVRQLTLAPDGKTVAAVRVAPVEGSEVKGGWRFVEVQVHLLDVTDPPAKTKPLWAEKIGQDHRKINGPVSLAFSPDGKTLLAAFGDPFNNGEDDKGVRHTGLIPSSVGVRVWELVPKK